MFVNRRKRYNGDVAALLPAFRIDMDEAGIFKFLNILDVCWSQKYTVYEAALLVAYSYASGLLKGGRNKESLQLYNRIIPIRDGWVKKAIVRQHIVSRMESEWAKKYSDYLNKVKSAETGNGITGIAPSPDMPDLSRGENTDLYRFNDYLVFFFRNLPPWNGSLTS